MVILQEIDNEADLTPQHKDQPIYVPSLKMLLTVGHFITFNDPESSDQLVGQILKRSIVNSSDVMVSIYLPLYDEQTHWHINTPPILPRRISHMSCINATELVKTSKVAEVSPAYITGLAFIFLNVDVTEYVYHIQGMKDASVIRFKYSPSTNDLHMLSRTDFFSFPDLYVEHQMRWCECVGLTIFNSIDDLRQEL
jgi:hypothetical protein